MSFKPSTNHYPVSESSPSAILKDFYRFLDFFTDRTHQLTGRRHFFKRQELFALNQQLSHQASGVNPRCDQPLYLELHLFYFLSRNSRLFSIDLSASGRRVIWQPVPENIAAFKALNPTEQYFFLFKTLWMFSDWEEIQPEQVGQIFIPDYIDSFFINLAAEETEKDDWISLSFDEFFQLNNVHGILRYLELFGFWTCRYRENAPPYLKQPVVSDLKLTPFGKAMVKRISEVALPGDWNYFLRIASEEEAESMGFLDLIDSEEIQEMIDEIEEDGRQEEISPYSLREFNLSLFNRNPDGQQEEESEEEDEEGETFFDDGEEVESTPLEAYFRDLFPTGELGKVTVLQEIPYTEGRYQFRVYLKYAPHIWRIIELDASHTLQNLHEMIQEAYGFDDDHLFSFFLDDRPYSKIAIHDDRSGRSPTAGEVRVGDLGLSERTQFLYLFDFGENWEFEVLLMAIDSRAPALETPRVTEIHGDSPPQYSSDWEDDEEEEEDW